MCLAVTKKVLEFLKHHHEDQVTIKLDQGTISLTGRELQ